MTNENGIRLTAEQQSSADRLLASINNRLVNTVLLEGGAGTGKTTTLGTALRQGLSSGVFDSEQVLCAAPTHRAAAQFKKSLQREGVDLDVSTVHSLLKVTMKRCPKTGLLINDPQADFSIPANARAILIDEASMVSDWMLWRLLNAVGSKTTLIGIGDRAQLPPVGRDLNFLFEDAAITLGLSTVMRHQGPILDLANAIRNLEVGLPRIVSNADGESKVQVAKGFHFKREFETATRIAARNGTQDQLRLLSYTRKDTDSWAWAARQVFHRLEDRTQPWIKFERLTNVDALMGHDGEKEEVLLPPSSEVEMLEVGKEVPCDVWMHADWGEPYMQQTCTFREVHTQEVFEAPVIVPRDVARFKQNQKEMLDYVKDPRNAGESDLREVGTLYTDRALQVCCLQPIHATTIHKSQGSTFETVFLDLTGVQWMNAKGRVDGEILNKLAYVGVSRAAKRVVINVANQ